MKNTTLHAKCYRSLVGSLRWWVRRVTHLAHVHNLNPNVFIILSLVGLIIHSLYYVPSFKGQSTELAFLVGLRFLALVAPFYILIKGKRIAPVLNASLVVSWTLSTTWHVCYFVYL